jgi:hypothetical protein
VTAPATAGEEFQGSLTALTTPSAADAISYSTVASAGALTDRMWTAAHSTSLRIMAGAQSGFVSSWFDTFFYLF